MIRKTSLLSGTAVLIAAAFSPAAFAAPIISNGDFEAPDFTGDAQTGTVWTGWSGAAHVGDENETGRVPGSSVTPLVNNQVVRVHHGSSDIYQDTGHLWSATDMYSLSFNASEAYWRTAAAGEEVTVTLRQTSDSTVLWSSGVIDLDGTHTGVAMPAWTPGQTFALNFDASTFTAGSAGEAVQLHFQGATSSSIFYLDNVSLDVVPEPSSLALLGLGGLAMIRRRR